MNTIAIIDDEIAFGNFIGKVATEVGFNAMVTSDVGDFRRALKELSPSVLVIDLLMPEVDGIELLRELGEQQSKAKIIMVSGMDSRVVDSSRRMGTELGLTMAGAFSKPVRAPELKGLLETLLPESLRISPDTLRKAIQEEQLFLTYQPKVDIKRGRMTAVEALVRWKEESGKVIYPDSFIPMAEKSGAIADLTGWVIENSLRQAAVWFGQGLDLQVAINLSAKCIHDRHLPDQLLSSCRRLNVPPERIILELTETASQHDTITLLDVLGRFRLKGFHLSIDDFGTGYSSISQLLKLPFTELKVDKSFVCDMDQVKDSAIVSKTIVDLAHNLGLSVVAEGVENEAALNMLREWGCEIVQGYYFSKPVAPSEIATYAADGFSWS